MAIRGFHAHIYFDPPELERAQAFAEAARAEFGCPVGHFHAAPVGPHPRGSVQMTVPTDLFVRDAKGKVTRLTDVNRAQLAEIRIEARMRRLAAA